LAGGDGDLDLEDDEDLLEAPEEDLEDFVLLLGGGDIDDLRGPLANSASAALDSLSLAESFPVSPPEVDFFFLSSGSFLIFLMIPVDEEAKFINLF
jgi:hypothetical protein